MAATRRDPQLRLSESEVSHLDDFSVCDKLWNLVVESYHSHESTDWENSLSNYPESLFAKTLSFHWWVVYALHTFEYDFLAGGLEQFFDNHFGQTNAETLAAFNHVGAHEYTEVFAEACEVFDRFRELFTSDNAFDESAYGRRRALFSEATRPVDERLWALLRGNRDPRSYLAVFIRRHLELFQQSPSA